MHETVFSFRREIGRKLIHLSGLWIPYLVYLLETRQAIFLFLGLSIFALLIEILRQQDLAATRWINRMFLPLLRHHELRPGFHFTGISYTLISTLLVTSFFSKLIAITALSIMLISDAVSALVGKCWGKHPILNKTYEGSAAFFVSALLTVWVIGQLVGAPASFYSAGIMGAFVSTFVELISGKLKLDDNLTITLSAAVTMWLTLLVIA